MSRNAGVGFLVALFFIIVIAGTIGVIRYTVFQKQCGANNGKFILLTSTIGDVTVRKADSTEWLPARLEEYLGIGDSIKTSSNSSCEFQIVKRGIFRLVENSEVCLNSLSDKSSNLDSKMKLSKGRMLLNPSKLEDNEGFHVETSTAVVAVRGTKFSVGVDDKENLDVAVTEGLVTVTPIIQFLGTARDQGMIDEKACVVLGKKILGTIELSPGESASLEKASLDRINIAVRAVIEKEVSNHGKISVDKLAEVQSNTIAISSNTNLLTELMIGIVQEISYSIDSNMIQNPTNTNEVSESGAGKIMVKGNSLSVVKTVVSERVQQGMNSLNLMNIISNSANTVRIGIQSTPSGADVEMGGAVIGKTPLERVMDKGRRVNIRISRTGFEDYAADQLEITNGWFLSVALKAKSAAVIDTVTSRATASSASTVISSNNNLKTTKTNASIQKINKAGKTEGKAKAPGELEWKKDVKVASVDKEPLIYAGSIYLAIGNRLKILSLDGITVRNLDVIGKEYRVTRPAAADGQVYVGSDNGGIYAYSTEGKLLWKGEAGAEKFGLSPVAAGGIVAVPSLKDGIKIYSSSGELKDFIAVEDAIYATPILLNGGKLLVYGTEKGDVTAYHLETRKVVWTKHLFDERILYPLVGDDSAIIVLLRSSGKTAAIHPGNGAILWENNFPELVKTAINPIYGNGKVVLSTGGAHSSLMVLNASNGQLAAKIKPKGGIVTPFILDNAVYTASSSGEIESFNPDGGLVKWTYKSGWPLSLVVADNKSVYAFSSSGMYKILK